MQKMIWNPSVKLAFDSIHHPFVSYISHTCTLKCCPVQKLYHSVYLFHAHHVQFLTFLLVCRFNNMFILMNVWFPQSVTGPLFASTAEGTGPFYEAGYCLIKSLFYAQTLNSQRHGHCWCQSVTLFFFFLANNTERIIFK